MSQIACKVSGFACVRFVVEPSALQLAEDSHGMTRRQWSAILPA
jgi:hypothetical protein